MNRLASTLAALPGSRAILAGLLAFLVILFAAANLPWHLDNYDQAKQAYVAFEITKAGKWLTQSTPDGRSASKPPLMGWTSAALRSCGMPWDFAWRLPSFLCALAMLGILARAGGEIMGVPGAMLAAAAFGLNLLTPRLATLVRTDMMLAFFIFVVGWMICRKIREDAPWTASERWVVFAAMTAALFTKGPVIYAFLLPGIVAFALCALPKDRRGLVWSGWWTWLIPLALFALWLGIGLASDAQFYDDVVVREFLTRFQQAARPDERAQPLWFYLPHLIHKFAPWSLLLLALPACFPQIRRRLRADPVIFWLLVWSLGGLLVMTFIPAKRVDRIYPVVPPLCLLVAEGMSLVWQDRRARIAAGATIIAGLLFAGGYFLGLIPLSIHERSAALVEFAASVKRHAATHGIAEVRVLRSRDEGLLLYLDQLRFVPTGDGFDLWENGQPAALVMSDRTAIRFQEKFGTLTPALDSGPLRAKNEKRYYLLTHP